jgi:hypothetical protein
VVAVDPSPIFRDHLAGQQVLKSYDGIATDGHPHSIDRDGVGGGEGETVMGLIKITSAAAFPLLTKEEGNLPKGEGWSLTLQYSV